MFPEKYSLPDLLLNWPWDRFLSPYYTESKRESSIWVRSFQPFNRKGQKAFDACDLNLLASLTYSNRGREFVRVGCDLMNFYFVYDEYTDVSDPSVAHKLANLVIDIMKEENSTSQPHANNTHILGEMTREFWHRARTLARPGSPCFDHFIATSETYLRAVTQEVMDRVDSQVRSVDDYLILRRDTSGARPTLALIEFGLDLPEEVTSHPVIASLTQCAVDLIICVNDMHSYVREFSCGQANHNILTASMREYDLDLQSALDWLGEFASEIIVKFIYNLHHIPSWGPEIDDSVQTYINGLGQRVRGNDDWSCEGMRYYGTEGLRIRDSRIITINRKADHYLKIDLESDSEDERSHMYENPVCPKPTTHFRTDSVVETEESDRAFVYSTDGEPLHVHLVSGLSPSISTSSTTSKTGHEPHFRVRKRLHGIRQKLLSWWSAISRANRPTITSVTRETATTKGVTFSTPRKHLTRVRLTPTPKHLQFSATFKPTLHHKRNISDISFLDMDS